MCHPCELDYLTYSMKPESQLSYHVHIQMLTVCGLEENTHQIPAVLPL